MAAIESEIQTKSQRAESLVDEALGKAETLVAQLQLDAGNNLQFTNHTELFLHGAVHPDVEPGSPVEFDEPMIITPEERVAVTDAIKARYATGERHQRFTKDNQGKTRHERVVHELSDGRALFEMVEEYVFTNGTRMLDSAALHSRVPYMEAAQPKAAQLDNVGPAAGSIAMSSADVIQL